MYVDAMYVTLFFCTSLLRRDVSAATIAQATIDRFMGELLITAHLSVIERGVKYLDKNTLQEILLACKAALTFEGHRSGSMFHGTHKSQLLHTAFYKCLLFCCRPETDAAIGIDTVPPGVYATMAH